MSKLTNLQARIESIAMAKLEKDIENASRNLRDFYSSQKGLFRTAISVYIAEGDRKYYPYLSQLFDCEPIRKKIIENNLPDYIDREITNILTKKQEE